MLKSHFTASLYKLGAVILLCGGAWFLVDMASKSQSPLVVEKSHLDEGWYPSEKAKLQTTIADLATVSAQKYNAALNPSDIRAIIVPHAGYAYSGAVAASVYRLLDVKNIKKLIILAPDHSVSFDGVALPFFDQYQTPLGMITIDTSMVDQLAQKELFHKKRDVFASEHSLEIQLPLIQTYVNAQTKILPLFVGKLTCDQAKSIARDLIPFIDQHTLVIVSTDFIHYGKRFHFTPFKDNIMYRIRNLNSQAVHSIEQGTCASFATFVEQTKATICGYHPLEIFLSLMELSAFGSIEPRLIAYDTSSTQITNDVDLVSYIGMVFTRQKLNTLPIEQQLTQQEQRGLIQEAKDILYNLFDKEIDEELLYPIQSFGVTRAHGAFATLEKQRASGKELRGCIGRITTPDPLYKTVATVTRDTALHDTRFTPVKKEELPNLALKLSILSSIQPLDSYKDIILGKHGVILENNGHAATFLPEVPLEFGWNLEKMLAELSEKAGLATDAWRDKKTTFQVFTTVDIKDQS